MPGITINDNFQVLDKYGAYSDRIYIMAAPYIGGYNPDYSGLDFCEAYLSHCREYVQPETYAIFSLFEGFASVLSQSSPWSSEDIQNV